MVLVLKKRLTQQKSLTLLQTKIGFSGDRIYSFAQFEMRSCVFRETEGKSAEFKFKHFACFI